MKTYWLYYGNNVVTAVLLPEYATEREVKLKALDENLRIALCERPTECPGDMARKITLSHVKTF